MVRCLTILLLFFCQTAVAERPRLYIVHSDSCLPCRIFEKRYCNDPEFKAALQNAYELRSLDWDIPEQRDKAIALGIVRLPGFSAWRGNRNIRTFTGFVNTEKGTQDFMNLLNIEWPRPEAPAPPVEQPVKPPVRAPDPVPPAVLEEAVKSQLKDFSSKSEAERKEILQSIASLKGDLSGVEGSLKKTLDELAKRSQDKPDPAPAESAVSPPIVNSGSSSPTAAKWLAVLSWAGKAALTVAAPEVALPASAGLTVLGGLMTWARRRRQQKAASVPQLGTRANPITVSEPAQIRTETKYVVHETDMLGEAYREGIRRVGNAYRENRPDIIEILKQVDAAADQIFHGQRVVKRPQTAQVSENSP